MKIISDLHIHSRFSRATSKDITIANLEKYARIKGLNLLGTGDFTHPLWLKELKKELTEDDSGILKTKTGFNFILQSEISLIYTQNGKGRKVHNVILAKNFDIVEQINGALLKKGRLDYDGRPIFGMSCVEFVEMMKSIDKDIEIIPAHCLLPDTKIHTDCILKSIQNIKKGDKVYTHKGRFKKVEEIYKRDYDGTLYHIVPWYFSEGLESTGEHPFYSIKSFKKCKWTNGLCRPKCSQIKHCRRRYFENYVPEWLPAKDLEVGDVLLYPRYKKVKDRDYIKLKNKKLRIDKNFYRLVGYFLSEGYSNGRDAICFTFNEQEKNHIGDVKKIMFNLFRIECKKGKSHFKSEDLIFYSKRLVKFFEDNFYKNKKRGASNKKMPNWMLDLPSEKQVEIFKGWWYGDAGYTSSVYLMNQIKTICLRLGIIPSIRVDKSNRHKEKFIFGRKIKKIRDNFVFSNLSFFEDKFDLLKDDQFIRFKTNRDTRHGWIDDKFVYLPIRKIKTRKYKGKVYNLEVERDNSYVSEFVCVHNCWTPWFSLFGSNSGFDSVEECFKDQTKYIHALETGLSSDPAMNWRLSQLDNFSLVSFSDLHSFWPWRIGREATVFDIELSYDNMINALKTRKGLVETIEVDPNYGKYHFDGHRLCGVCLSPKESINYKDICPKCGRKLTIGVLHRIEELADREEGFKPENAVPFKSLIPLSEVISSIINSPVASQKTWKEYHNLINKFGSEFDVLLDASLDELKKVTDEKIAKAIIDSRERKISINPGYDGVYGEPVFGKKEIKKVEIKHAQKGLDEFC